MKRFLNKYSKLIVLYSIAFVSAYIVANVVLFYATGLCMPDALTILVGGFFGAEAGILGWIKTSEKKKESEEM